MASIEKLTEQIDSTHVHFVRTIKTNAAMKPGYYQPDYVIGQLRDQGLFSLCDLLKAGYPTRIGPQSPLSSFRFLPVFQYLLKLASGVWVLECGVLTFREA